MSGWAVLVELLVDEVGRGGSDLAEAGSGEEGECRRNGDGKQRAHRGIPRVRAGWEVESPMYPATPCLAAPLPQLRSGEHGPAKAAPPLLRASTRESAAVPSSSGPSPTPEFSMRIHFPSVTVGVVAAALILITMSQALPGSANPPRIEYGPHPRDMVQITDGTPFTVPAGQIFVLTAMGTTFGQGNCIVQINGQTSEVLAQSLSGASAPISMYPVPPGFTVQGGSTVNILSQNAPGSARAWGYLSK